MKDKTQIDNTPAYLSGRNLAESYYLALPVLSWQSLIVGDPLCRLQ